MDICRISKALGRHRLKSSITKSTIIIDADEIPDDMVDMLFAYATIVGAQDYQVEDSNTNDYVETKSEKDDESTTTSIVEESKLIYTSETDVKGDTLVEIPVNNYIEGIIKERGNSMNLTLTVNKKESTNMSSLVKQMCSLKCRINVDSINGNISIIGIDDDNVESVIDAISETFDITDIDIAPNVIIHEPEKPVITEDSIEFEKVEFNDAEVQEQVNRLLRTIYLAMYFSKAKSHDICQYLMTANTEIIMNYNPKALTKFAIGDIVDFSYGAHLKNEISGGHVHSIICDIDESGLVYAVPIVKGQREGDETRYLRIAAKIDAEYNNARFTGGTVLLKMGRYMNPIRARKVIGHVLPEFFHKLLMALPTTVDFSSKYNNYEYELAERLGDVQNDDSMLSFESSEETPTEGAESNDIAKKASAEDYVTNIIADALNSLDKSKPVEEQIDDFLDAIDLPKDVKFVRSAFIVACIVKKVGYESIILELHNEYPKIREEIIKENLKEEFKKWLTKHPDVKENYPKISIIALLKIFAKKMT